MSAHIGNEVADSDWLRDPASLAEKLSGGRWKRYHHLDFISNKVKELENRPIFLIVTIPPRHGKSELISHWTPVWFLKRWPYKHVILASYQAGFAADWGGVVRNSIVEHEAQLGLSLAMDTRSKSQWRVKGYGGGMLASGVMGPITGHGGDLLIIDDPIKSQKEALSLVYRESIKQWYRSTFRTRAQPNASIILLMCMTGDTPVLMADGTELPLRKIKVGDQVATYDNGSLATSTVRNCRSSGLDSVFQIKTTSGIIAHANERHPFLVEEHGKLKWIRLRNLTTAHRIVTVRDNGANGRGKHASLRAVRKPLAHGDIALHTITKECGQTDIARRQSMQSIDATCVLSSDTGSPLRSTMQCLWRKTASVRFANNRQGATSVPTGAGSYALITATKQIPSEDFCATIVTLPWAIPRQRQPHLPSLNTSDFTTAQIESIESAGVEEVFDIQIDRTENFIANGLVSHNTRWHEDDLAGYLVSESRKPESDLPRDPWEVINLPALAEPEDPLGRSEGEALWPEMYPRQSLLQVREAIGPYWYSAEYQGYPRPEGGSIIKEAWFQYYSDQENPLVNESIKVERCIQVWDTAFELDDSSSRSACMTWVKAGQFFYVIDVWAKRVEFPDLIQAAKMKYNQWKPTHIYIEHKASGHSLVQQLRRDTSLPIIPVKAETDKASRLNAVSGIVEAGRVKLPTQAPWLSDFLYEICSFPAAKTDDIADCFAHGLMQMHPSLGRGDLPVRRGVKESIWRRSE
jgi:predicted phage terminase large subunit-like protein